jgi:hypothetical protein
VSSLKVVTNITQSINYSDVTLHKVKIMAKVTYQDCQKITTIKQEIMLDGGVKGCGVQAFATFTLQINFMGKLIANSTDTTIVSY